MNILNKLPFVADTPYHWEIKVYMKFLSFFID